VAKEKDVAAHRNLLSSCAVFVTLDSRCIACGSVHSGERRRGSWSFFNQFGALRLAWRWMERDLGRVTGATGVLFKISFCLSL